MAVRAFTQINDTRFKNVRLYKWTGLLNGDTGAPIDVPNYSEKTVQATGTFGVGGTVTVEGTIDPESSPVFGTLRKPDHTNLTLTTSQPATVLEDVTQIRPNVTAGDGTTSLTFWLLAHTTR